MREGRKRRKITFSAASVLPFPYAEGRLSLSFVPRAPRHSAQTQQGLGGEEWSISGGIEYQRLFFHELVFS